MFPPLLLLAQLAHFGSSSEYSNDFILQFSDWLTNDDIDKIAAENGLINKGRVIGDRWHFINPRLKRRDLSGNGDSTIKHLQFLEGVTLVQQLKILKRVKRDFNENADNDEINFDKKESRKPRRKLYQSRRKNRRNRHNRKSRRPKNFEDEARYYQNRKTRRSISFNIETGPNDEKYPKMWYLNPNYQCPSNSNQCSKPRISKTNSKDDRIRHMNVTGAWELGYTGKGVVVTILDDGIEADHPDLIDNYWPQASYDRNDNDFDPTPRYNPTNENRHGTRCAGQVGASANNGRCVPGIAFNAKIGGIRMLDGDVTDLVEAKSIYPDDIIEEDRGPGSKKKRKIADIIDIYSASWGPDDDGKTVDGPADMAKVAFQTGTSQGRDGKGSIYIWASGNGGRWKDNCNCDGYINSIYTISVSSTSEKEMIPWYSEPCASTLASTYSSGGQNEKQIITTDLRKICTESHTGTSASAPMAAAIVALTLEANPDLGWRDVQHIIIRTSKRQLLQADDWSINGVGREFSHRYGYGLMDAGAMAYLARDWQNVPKMQRTCQKGIVKSSRSDHRSISEWEKSVQIDFKFGPEDCVGGPVDRLEHVIAKLTIKFERRGACQIFLTSPSGTRSMILGPRPQDNSTKGFYNFQFMSVHFWDENPNGKWTLEVKSTEAHVTGTVKRFELIVHGTGDDQWEKEERRNRETFQNSTFDEKSDESDAVSSVDESELESSTPNDATGSAESVRSSPPSSSSRDELSLTACTQILFMVILILHI